MKKMSKLLSVIVALMLCVSMIAPAMAAIEINQDIIDSLECKEKNGSKYVEIETDEDGVVNMTGDITTDRTLAFKNQGDVTLNMNGNTLDHNDASGSAIYSEDTNLIINGADEDGKRGVITGGNAENDNGTDNFGAASGGGILSLGGDLTVNDVELTDNNASYRGSAIHATNEVPWGTTEEEKGTANVTLNNVYIHDNTTSNANRMPDNGAVSIDRANVTITNSTISNNTTGGVGGGVTIRQADDVLIKDSVISGNESGVDWNFTAGSGMLVEISKNVTIQNTEFSNNKAMSTGSDSRGGGAEFNGVENLTIEDSKFTGNSAYNGGGMTVQNDWAGDGVKPGTVTIKNTEFSGNSAGGYGGGMYVKNVSSVTMTDTQIIKNTAGESGGGMYIFNGDQYSWNGEVWVSDPVPPSTTVTGVNTVIADNKGWNGVYANDVYAFAYNGTINMKFGPVTYGDKVFDGWSDSLELTKFVREGNEADANGVFGNSYSGIAYHYMTFHWTVPAPTQPGPNPPVNPTPVNPDPVNPDPDPDPEDPVEIEDPETPLGELPDDPVDIDDPEIPLGELPEIEIDEPEVPLSDVPQTGEASTVMFVAVLLVSGMGLVYLNTGKRKENA